MTSKNKSSRPIIVITMGDPCGIGPEVVAKALASEDVHKNSLPLVIGSAAVLQDAIRATGVSLSGRVVRSPEDALGEVGVVNILDQENLVPGSVALGEVSAVAGKASMEWVLTAAELAQSGQVQAIVTAPINKEASALAGYKDVGHMEVFQRLSGAKDVATMLMSGPLRVVHMTTHKTLRRAPDFVTRENVIAKLELTHSYFRQWGFEKPRIGVAALNPHASDGGLLGTEEEEHISPAIEEARSRGIEVWGPVPADTIFHQAIKGMYDVVIAMYHDQGHIPIKVYGFEKSISVNLGLPFIRTSVDHGTAFDIAGKGIADDQSMREAIRVAVSLASRGRLE